MADREEAARLLAAAEHDLRALQAMGDAKAFSDQIFGFHAQQAVEKVLKAWLAFLEEEYPRTHDISLLVAKLAVRGEQVDTLVSFVEFNPFAVQFRYEAFDEMGEPLDRDAVCARVGELFRRVRAIVDGATPA